MIKNGWKRGLALVAALALYGCGQAAKTTTAAAKTDAHDHDHEHDHGHHHEPPHGGTLVELGDHFANLEFVLDKASGKLTCYVLDGHAENGMPMEASEIALKVKLADGSEHELKLKGVASSLTGETVDKTSQYEGVLEALKGAEKLRITVPALKLKGTDLPGQAVNFPQGSAASAGHEGHEH